MDDLQIVKELKTLSERIFNLSKELGAQNDTVHTETGSNSDALIELAEIVIEQNDALIELADRLW